MDKIILAFAIIFFTVPVLFLVVAGCITVWNLIIDAILDIARGIRDAVRSFYRQQYLNTAYSGEKLYWDAKTNTLYGPVLEGE